MPLEDGDLVNTNFRDTIKVTVGQAVIDDKQYGPKNSFPTGFEDVGRLLPGEPARPSGQVDLIRKGHLLFAISPGHCFNLDAAYRTQNPARRVP